MIQHGVFAIISNRDNSEQEEYELTVEADSIEEAFAKALEILVYTENDIVAITVSSLHYYV